MTAPAGIEAITSRIAELQSRFAALLPPATASSNGFASALAGASADLGVSTDPSLTGAGNATGGQVVAKAQQYLGVPYRWGGTDPASGLDCSGLVQRVYADLGVNLPRVAADQATVGQPVPSLAAAQPGDLVAFGSPVDHIGIYAGNNTMIVAPHTGSVVRVEQITRTPTAIRRIVGTGDASAVNPAGPAPRMAGAAAYQQLFDTASAKYGVPSSLLSAVARVESGYDPTAVSPAGAQGLMQLMPDTASGLGVNAFDPAQAVDGAARLLAGHLKTYGGSVPLALAAYNAGPGAVARYGGVPPYPETQAYVARVLAYAGEAG